MGLLAVLSLWRQGADMFYTGRRSAKYRVPHLQDQTLLGMQGERLVTAINEAVRLRAPAVDQVVQAPAPVVAIPAVQPPVRIQAPLRSQRNPPQQVPRTRVEAALVNDPPVANAFGPANPPRLLAIPQSKELVHTALRALRVSLPIPWQTCVQITVKVFFFNRNKFN